MAFFGHLRLDAATSAAYARQMESFRIRTRVGETEIEVSGPTAEFVIEQTARLTRELRDAAPRPQGSPRDDGPSKQMGDRRRPVSLRELVQLVAPGPMTEVAAVVAYFLEHHADPIVKAWKPAEVSARFADIKKAAPSNPSMTIGSSQYFMRASDPTRYTLSESGVRWVESRLSDEKEKGV